MTAIGALQPVADDAADGRRCPEMRHSGTTPSNDEVVWITDVCTDFCMAYAVSEPSTAGGERTHRPSSAQSLAATPKGKPREPTSANSRCHVPGRWKHSSAHAGDGMSTARADVRAVVSRAEDKKPFEQS